MIPLLRHLGWAALERAAQATVVLAALRRTWRLSMRTSTKQHHKGARGHLPARVVPDAPIDVPDEPLACSGDIPDLEAKVLGEPQCFTKRNAVWDWIHAYLQLNRRRGINCSRGS
jgi:hypothetical protein